jgi:hypothetical protein
VSVLLAFGGHLEANWIAFCGTDRWRRQKDVSVVSQGAYFRNSHFTLSIRRPPQDQNSRQIMSFHSGKAGLHSVGIRTCVAEGFFENVLNIVRSTGT